jgi:hypothetical protein
VFLRSWWRDGDAGPWLTDSHAHRLTDAAGVPLPWPGSSVAAFHRRVAGAGTTPMDVLEPAAAGPPGELAARLRAGLARAASAGPPHSRLAPGDAFRIMSDERAGHTVLSADPRAVPGEIDRIEVLGTSPVPF